MKLLVATSETQKQRKSDFNWCEEGEIVGFGFQCDCDGGDPDGKCGCRRDMLGLKSNKFTTTFKVVSLPITRSDLICKIEDNLILGGWGNAGLKVHEVAREDADELIRIAARFRVNDIVEKRGDLFQTRRVAVC